jgi:hypothetical protein
VVFLHRTLALASALCYLAALAFPAYGGFNGQPLFGWECLIYGWQLTWMWAANLFLFGAWFAYVRGSLLAAYWAAGALGTSILFTSESFKEEGFQLLPGHILWLIAMGFALIATVLALAKPKAVPAQAA